MQVELQNAVLDDAPDRDECRGFLGMDCNTNPVELDPRLLADGENLWMKGGGDAETRPGSKLNAIWLRAYLNTFGPGAPSLTLLAAGYYDIPGYEATVFFTTNGPFIISSAGDNVLPTQLVPVPPATTAMAGSGVVQLIDRLFYIDTFGRLTWLRYNGGAWTSGNVINFSTGAAMPTWARIVTQGFRVMLVETEGIYIYASAIGTANNVADWVPTENVRVGSGEGDPARAVLAGQGRYLTLLNGRTAWQIDTSTSTVASWSILQVSRAVGCVEGRTAVATGQDVFFLSRFGVIQLGALEQTINIAPQQTLSYPIQPIMDRINWTYISTSFAVSFRDYYLLAVPLDSETKPTRFLPFNLTLKVWQPPWKFTGNMPTWPGAPGTDVWHGLTGGLVVSFGDKSETLVFDDAGMIMRLDTTAETDQYVASIANTAGYPATTGDGDIVAQLRTKNFTHGSLATVKQPFWLELEFTGNTVSSSIYAFVLTENRALSAASSLEPGYVAQITPTTTGVERKRLLLRGLGGISPPGAYREAAIQLIRVAKRMRVRSVALSAFIDPPFKS